MIAAGNIAEVIGIVSTTVVAILGIQQAYTSVRARMKNLMSWRTVEKGISELVSQMRRDSYMPDMILAMGRGGAIMAGLLSSRFYRHRAVPVFLVDREYDHLGKERIPRIRTDIMDFVTCPRSVLLIAGVNAGGGTLEVYTKWVTDAGAGDVRSAVLVDGVTSRRSADYSYKREAIDPESIKMPWYKDAVIDWAGHCATASKP